MNIFDFAMNMERDGKAYYEKLAAETPVVALKTIFAGLAKDEQKHYEIIEALKAGTCRALVDSTVLDEAKNVFVTLMQDKTVSGGLKTALEGYQYARKIEADSIRYYEDMAKKEADSDAVRLILAIVNEEQRHYAIMDNLCEFILAPQTYLAWAEFSNLKEY